MKYIDEFRNIEIAKTILTKIKFIANKNKHYRLMEFCGGHTHAIYRYGFHDLLPQNIELVHGPGCPVCVLPVSRIQMAIDLIQKYNITLFSYGDMLRIPCLNSNSLLKLKSLGADVQMLYSPLEALKYAETHPFKQVVFFAIGFETTTPPTAAILQKAKQIGLDNFSIICNHLLTPSAILALFEGKKTIHNFINGIIGPAHVSTIIGSDAYTEFAKKYKIPVVISGFEPLDILQSIYQLINLINDNNYYIENEYTRFVTKEGNIKAQKMINECMEISPSFEWRGLGFIPNSSLKINNNYANFDAELRFNLTTPVFKENSACACGEILRGEKKPTDCHLFANVCTPETPIGACMVSSEGACAAHYLYKYNL